MSKQPHGEIVMRTIAMPADANVNGDIFGGWLVSQMDLGGAVLAKQISRKRVVTVAIDKMVFHNPVNVGDIITCYAALIKTGTSSMMINVEAWVMPLSPKEQVKVTEAIFTFVAVNEEGRPIPVHNESEEN